MVELEVEMAEKKAKKTGQDDMVVKTMQLLAEMAEKGDLAGMLRMVADYFEERAQAGGLDAEGKPIAPLPARWPAFGIRLPLRDRKRRHLKDGDLAVLFWGFSLVCTLHRAMDGGRHTRIYLTAGRKQRLPSDEAVLAAASLLRRSGLKVRLGERRVDARLITVSH